MLLSNWVRKIYFNINLADNIVSKRINGELGECRLAATGHFFFLLCFVFACIKGLFPVASEMVFTSSVLYHYRQNLRSQTGWGKPQQENTKQHIKGLSQWNPIRTCCVCLPPPPLNRRDNGSVWILIAVDWLKLLDLFFFLCSKNRNDFFFFYW